jgi:hypothetical protein
MERKDEPVQETPSQQNADGKTAWQRPELMRMGHLKDFVQGAGKGGSAFPDGPARPMKALFDLL